MIYLKKLINLIYKDHLFFKEGKEKFPDLESLILNRIIEKGQSLKDRKTHLRKWELAEIDFDDPELRLIFYKMMKGTRGRSERGIEGYPSLKDFIMIEKEKNLISLYLAPKETLLAIFDNPQIVDSLLSERKRIYKESKRKNAQIDGEKLLREKFENQISSEFKPLINFGVSKTDPGPYE